MKFLSQWILIRFRVLMEIQHRRFLNVATIVTHISLQGQAWRKWNWNAFKWWTALRATRLEL
jgi:hypothetical protein